MEYHSPVPFPNQALVHGIQSTMMIRQGTDLKILTIKPTMKLRGLQGRRPFFEVTLRSIPQGSPKTYANNVERTVIRRVSPVMMATSAKVIGVYLLVCYAFLVQIGAELVYILVVIRESEHNLSVRFTSDDFSFRIIYGY